MDRKNYIEILLKKRFGEKDPEKISCLAEINTFAPADTEQNSLGMGIQLIIDSNGHLKKEEYQINSEGIIFSWGDTPVLDKRSLEQKL